MTGRFWVLFFPIIFLAFSSRAAAPAHGKQRLRELVILPSMDLNFSFAWNFDGNLWRFGSSGDLREDIASFKRQVNDHPQNIQEWLQLGFLYSLNQQTNESQAAFEKAESLCRERVINRPKDGLLLTQFAKALDELGKDTQAESTYRQATVVSAEEWRTWAGLGIFLAARADAELLPAEMRRNLLPFSPPPDKVLDYQPPEEALKAAVALAKEADQCMFKAMSLATNEPDAFMQQASFAQTSAMTGFWIHYFQHGKFLDNAAWRATFPAQKSSQAMQKASDLTPKDSRLIATAIYADFMGWFLEHRPRDYDPSQMPEALIQKVHNGMARLETLANDSDKKTACNALLSIAMLKLLMKGSPADARELAQRAVQLDPRQEQAWDMWLAGSLADNASAEQLLKICESRLKQNNSANNHLLMAKALIKDSKWAEADAQTQEAIKLEPENVMAQIMGIAICIHQSTDDETLKKCLGSFVAVTQILAKTLDSKEKQNHWREAMLNQAIAQELYSGQDYRKEARAAVDDVLKHFPDDGDAKEILEALE